MISDDGDRVNEFEHVDMSNENSSRRRRSNVDQQSADAYFNEHRRIIERRTSSHFISSPNNFLELKSEPDCYLEFCPTLESIRLKLINDNEDCLIFKLKTSQAQRIVAQPSRGFIPARSSIQCCLTPLEIEQEFDVVVQYGRSINRIDDFRTQWKQLNSNKLLSKKYLCRLKSNKLWKRLITPIIVTCLTLTLTTSFIYLRRSMAY